MASSVQSSDAAPLVNQFRDMLNDYVPESSSGAMVAVHSSALAHTAYNIIRNLHYTFLSEHFGVKDFAHFLSTRITFLEGALISLASAVHNLFFAVMYTVLVVGTLGIFQTIVRHCNHHWVNSYYSFLTTGTALASVVTPYYGSYLSLGLFGSILNSILQDYKNDISPNERQFLEKIKKVFNDNYNFIRNWVQGHYEDTFETELGPSLAWLHKKINEAKSIHYRSDRSDQADVIDIEPFCLVDVIDVFRKNYRDVNALEEGIKTLQLTRANQLKSSNQPEDSTPVESPNFYPLVSSIRKMLREQLPKSSSGAMVFLHSSALVHTAYNIIRNLHYTFLAEHFGAKDFAHFFSSRIDFLEGALISAAATVHNLFFAILYTVLVIATFGLSDTLARHRNYHWENGYYSLLSTATSMASIVTPYYGSGMSILLFVHIFNSILHDYRKESENKDTQIFKEIKSIFNDHYQIIYDWAKGYYGQTFATQEGLALDWLKETLNKKKENGKDEIATIHYWPEEPENICGIDVADLFVRHFPNLKALETAMNELKLSRRSNQVDGDV